MPKSDQGVQRERYTIIPRTLSFIFRGEAVLLIKGAPSKRLWANKYNGVGGHIERGEDVLTAARREVREETGLDIPALELYGTVIVDTGEDVGIGLFVFGGLDPGGEVIASSEGELEWIPVDRLDQYPLVEDIPVLVQKVRGRRRGEPLFAAHYSYDRDDQLVIRFG